MDIALLVLGFILTLVGILGSVLPILPGPPLSWLGLLLLYATQAVPANGWILGTTLALAVFVTVIDSIIPAIGAKKSGGSKAGMWGATVGLLLAVIFPILGPIGIIIWPFLGALLGELLNNAPQDTAVKAASGTFLGLLAGTAIKLVVAVLYMALYVYIAAKHAANFFSS